MGDGVEEDDVDDVDDDDDDDVCEDDVATISPSSEITAFGATRFLAALLLEDEADDAQDDDEVLEKVSISDLGDMFSLMVLLALLLTPLLDEADKHFFTSIVVAFSLFTIELDASLLSIDELKMFFSFCCIIFGALDVCVFAVEVDNKNLSKSCNCIRLAQ